MRDLVTHVFNTETEFRLFQDNEGNIRARNYGLKRQRIRESSPGTLQDDASRDV